MLGHFSLLISKNCRVQEVLPVSAIVNFGFCSEEALKGIILTSKGHRVLHLGTSVIVDLLQVCDIWFFH